MAGTAQKLMYLYPESVPDVDWRVEDDGTGAETITYWNPALGPQPTQAQLDAVTDVQVADAAITAKAKTEKEEAIAGVDNAFLKRGNRVERIVMSVSTSAMKVINSDRATLGEMNAAVQAATSLADLKSKFAAISWPNPITTQQLVNAVKADIAATPE